MKKLLFTWVAIALCGLFHPLRSQGYFQHCYGNFGTHTNDFEVAFDGHRTINNVDGHMISGYSWWNPFNSPAKISFAVTDVDGNITGSCFAKFYSLYDASNTLLSPRSVYCREVHGNEYALAGSDEGMHNVFYAQLNSAGTVLASNTYSLGSHYDLYYVNDIAKNAYDNATYIMGNVQDITVGRQVLFVMKVRYNGTLLWSQVYDMPLSGNNISDAWDGVEEPNAQEFTIVGFGYGSTTESFIFSLDANTGLPSGTPVLLPYDRTDQFYATCIDWSPDPALPSGGGYIVGGSTWYSSTPWSSPSAFLVDNNFNSPWFIGNNYANANDPTPLSHHMIDIETRYDPVTRIADYWMTGLSLAQLVGGNDTEVWRLDASINGVTQSLFTNGNGQVASLDLRDIAGTPALSVYGSATNGASGSNDDLMITRSYLSGHLPTGCDWLANTVATNSNMDMGSMSPPNPVGVYFSPTNGYITYTAPMNDAQICYGTSVSGGDNSKASNLVETTTEVSLIGNAEDGYSLTFSPATSVATTMHLSLHDMTGREIRSMERAVAPGTDAVDLKAWQSGIARGVYFVKWSYAANQGAQKIILGNL